MIHVCEPVLKAGRRTPKRVDALTAQMRNAIHVDFITGIKRFRNKVKPNELMRAWEKGSYSHLMAVIPWQDMHEEFKPLARTMEESHPGFAAAAIKALPAPTHNELRYDTKNPRISNFISRRTGELITDMSNEQEKVVRQAVFRTFNNAYTPRDVATDIKMTIGLNARYANAVHNYHSGLLNGGASPFVAQTMSNHYADRLLESRAMTVARTETAYVKNYGQLYVWQQASSSGLIPDTATKGWNAQGGDPCEVCDAMDGVEVLLYEAWELNNGDSVEVPNESHPNCYCDMYLNTDADQEAS